MSRFYLTRDAADDLDEIRRYLNPIPERFRAHSQGFTFHPERRCDPPKSGTHQSEATRILGEEVRTRVFPPYRIFYREHSGSSQILAILHTARDITSILSGRLQ